MEFPTECLRIIREFVYGIYFTEKLPNNELSTGYTAKPYPSTQSVDTAKLPKAPSTQSVDTAKLPKAPSTDCLRQQSITLFHGINRVYYSNGKIKNIFEYEWGAIKSQMKISKLGQKVYEYNYAASGVDRYNRPLRHGNQKKWNRFGKLIEDFNYSLGRKHGRQWAFDGDNCIEVSEYVNGICTARSAESVADRTARSAESVADRTSVIRGSAKLRGGLSA